jgi:Uma2 family endonuclease
MDMVTKLSKYLSAGVREYWIIDPDKGTLTTYDFAADDFNPIIYPLESTVPLAITEGDLQIDLAPVAQSIHELEGEG